MKFLLAQINPVVGDLEGNAKKILNIASKASSISADFVLTPELSLWGYPANDLLFKKNLIKNQYQILDQLALDINKKYDNLSISIGIAEKVPNSFFPNEEWSSNPKKETVTISLLKPLNQASFWSLVVPVLPAIFKFKSFNFLAVPL